MEKLLSAVLDAHGGLENWAGISRITAQMSLGGPFWGARGWPDVYSNQTVTIDPHREHIRFEPFTAEGRASVLDVGPERVRISTADGQVIEERLNGQGWALRGLGRAAAVRVGDARGVQVVSVDQCRAVDGAYERASSTAVHPGNVALSVEPDS